MPHLENLSFSFYLYWSEHFW